MKNRLLFLFIFLLLLTIFIITGAYYILVLIVILTALILVSFFSMVILSNDIQLKLVDKMDHTYFIYESKGLPLGKLTVNLNIENLFYEEVYSNQFEMIVGETSIKTEIPFDHSNLGKYQVNEQKFILNDVLGLFKKEIKRDIFTEMIQYPKLTQSMMDFNKVSEAVIAYQSSKSDDYDIREYRTGDSLKDIHYKISYKLHKYMIKEKYKESGNNVTVYLDLSGENDECEKVFVYLSYVIQNLQIYNETCIVKWISNKEIYEYKIRDLNDLKNCITKILSMPKCKEKHNVSCTWMITPSGLVGGE